MFFQKIYILRLSLHINLWVMEALVSEHAHMWYGVLHRVHQLVGVSVVEPVLDVKINDHLGDPHDLPEQVEGVPKPRVLLLSGGQGLKMRRNMMRR